MSGGNKIPKGWVETTLGHIAMYINRGIAPKYSEEEGILVINQRCIRDNKVTFENARFNNLELRKVSFEKTIQSDDILICSTGTGTLGRVAQIKGDIKTSTVDSHVTIVRPDKNIHKPFLGHLLCSKEREIEYLAEGSTGQTELPRKRLEVFPLCIPENQKEQIAIANIITAFDDKIELLQAQNQTLEATAQTIFKEWFGKYQIGDELPEGWRVGKLRELTEVISKGTTPRRSDLEGLQTEIPFLKVKDISDNGLINKNNLELIPKEVHNKQLKRSILKTNDILFSIAGTIGRVALVDTELNNANCNQAIAFIRLKDKDMYKEYVHLMLKRRETQNEINSSIVQGVQANVSLTVLGNLATTMPNHSQMKKWKDVIYPIYSKIENNINQIQTLQQTRDTLLPKLMSGKLRVDEFKD